MSGQERFGVLEFSEFLKERMDEAGDFDSLLAEARNYLAKFKWCKEIRSFYIGGGVGGIYAVFLFEIENSASPDDDWLWVVVGDIPPAYLVANGGPRNPQEALLAYINLMGEWVAAVKKGEPVGHLIPVNVPPTPKYAEMLESRIAFLRDRFVSG